MKRTVYEAPVTELFRIELEGAFMSASVVEGQSGSVTTTGHELNVVDLTSDDFKDNDWNGDSVDGWN